ncbi:MAG: hypothetical protein FH756_17290 [Firmicutes bacterium]|nr:hypothetical protein [Bacillota bacterium]
MWISSVHFNRAACLFIISETSGTRNTTKHTLKSVSLSLGEKKHDPNELLLEESFAIYSLGMVLTLIYVEDLEEWDDEMW